MERQRKVELLAPAGSYESMTAAIRAGADAVYMGGSKFGARAYADNPGEDRMLEAIDYVHLHGRKLYMTVNTLVKEGELPELFPFLKPYYERGLDAVIVQDMGVFSFLRSNFSDLPIHVSTQMTVTGAYGAGLLKELGAARIVTARELSLEEIREIRDTADIEIESFIHGALCYCYSGQCLFSSLIGGRSGNRGRCAQTCRLPFDVLTDGKVQNPGDRKYVLSLKDLCTLDIIPDILEAGVTSLKIEGRMKSPRYTAGVVSVYRKYVDLYLERGRDGYHVDPADRRALLDLFDRGGQTEGYYAEHNGRDMVVEREKPAFRTGNQILYDYLDETYVNRRQQEDVTGTARIAENLPVSLSVRMLEFEVCVEGEIPLPAVNQPMTEEKIRKQLNKTGNTPFCFADLKIEVEGKVFLPVQSLNELRRRAFLELERAVRERFQRNCHILGGASGRLLVETNRREAGPLLHVALEEKEGFSQVLAVKEVSEIYLDAAAFDALEWKTAVDRCHEEHKTCLLMMPHIFRSQADVYFKQNLDVLRQAGFDGVLIRSLEEVGFLQKHGIHLPMVFDHTMYACNHLAAAQFLALGAGRLTMPLELNSRELEETDCGGRELMVYGRLPMMVTAQCIQKTADSCGGTPGLCWLKDRMGKQFPVRNCCRFCYNTIYNSSPLSLLTDKKMIDRLHPFSVRLQFTTEDGGSVGKITEAFARRLVAGRESSYVIEDYTRGHFKRGVE